MLGHILGAILLGLALRGAVPTVAWVAMILSIPAHLVAFVVFQNPAADAAAWGLLAFAFARGVGEPALRVVAYARSGRCSSTADSLPRTEGDF